MDQRSNYLIQILDKIGAPLMSALTKTGDQENETDISQTAQNMAGLLSRTVQVSIDIGKSMDLGLDAEQADSIRVALAGLASPMIAEQYTRNQRIPEDGDLKQIVTSLEAVLTFSDNFTPSAENVERLKTIEATGATADPNQSIVQFIQALTPAVNAIGSFPFGQQEARLIQDVTDRLTKKSAELRENIWGENLPEDQQKPIELALMRALASIYAECHKAETDKLADGDGGTPSLDPVWKAFETRAAMLETIAASILPDSGSPTKASTQTVAPAPIEPPPAPPPIAPTETPPAAPPAAEPPSEPQASQPSAEGGNPMSSFIKPPENNDPAPTEAQPEQPPPSEPPPAQKEDPPPETPDDTTGETPPQDGGPMSFFKSPPKEGEDS